MKITFTLEEIGEDDVGLTVDMPDELKAIVDADEYNDKHHKLLSIAAMIYGTVILKDDGFTDDLTPPPGYLQ